MAAEPSEPDARIPGPRPSGPRFPFSAESGIGDSLIPDFGRIGNRGFPIPEKKRESGENRGSFKPLLFGMIRRPICGNRADFPSERPGCDQHQLPWTRNYYTQP